uniref:ABC transporter ATP-binding protein n=1 Tax=Citrifermentans bremense TaxID=60035 RepID=UPI0021F505E7
MSGISCSVGQGEFVALTGNSGSGKSTLLLALAGLLQEGSLDGSVSLFIASDAAAMRREVGIVFQNPEAQMLCDTVAEEVAFGPENLCLPPDEVALRVKKALRAVLLEGEEGRSTERFSAGQKQRLCIASVLSMQPSLLLLDEPSAQLDVRGKLELYATLSELKRKGHTIIMAEHDPRPFASLIDRYLTLDRGKLVGDGTSPPAPVHYRPKSWLLPYCTSLYGTRPILDVSGLSLSYPETGEVLKGVDLRVNRGQRVHLFGGNGAGKSSFLRCLAGTLRPDGGNVRIAGMQNPRAGTLTGKVGMLFQNPTRQLFTESVWHEVAFTMQRLGWDREEIDRIVAETLSFCGIAHLAQRAPLTLSYGEQHRVALAAAMAPRPSLLLLDEPFAGLDFPQRLSLLSILGRMPVRYDTTVLIASHDGLPDPRWADCSFVLEGGTIAAK